MTFASAPATGPGSSAGTPAPRLARARWRDPRLVLGLLLVLVSMVAGARVLATADVTVPVWSATSDLGPSIPLQKSDLEIKRVHLDGNLDRYVAAGDDPPLGRVLLRPVFAGELLPAAAIAPAQAADLRRLSVQVGSTTGISRGAVVDVYGLAASADPKAPARPARLVVRGVSVAEVEDAERISVAAGREVGLLVHERDVKPVLEARAAGDIALVQVAGADDLALAEGER